MRTVSLIDRIRQAPMVAAARPGRGGPLQRHNQGADSSYGCSPDRALERALLVIEQAEQLAASPAATHDECCQLQLDLLAVAAVCRACRAPSPPLRHLAAALDQAETAARSLAAFGLAPGQADAAGRSLAARLAVAAELRAGLGRRAALARRWAGIVEASLEAGEEGADADNG